MGKGSIELLLADMLYFNERFWQLRQEGYIKEFLVKYTPDPNAELDKPYRILLQRFEELVMVHEKSDSTKIEKRKLFYVGFRVKSGLDEERLVTYQIYSADSNSWDKRFKVARVVEHQIKSGEEHLFYVITTDKTLSGEQMRNFGHQRWYIENDGFSRRDGYPKMLNAHLKSKQCWSNHPKMLNNLISIWMLAFSLLWLFRREYDHLIRKKFCQAKFTVHFVAQILEQENFGRIRLDTS